MTTATSTSPTRTAEPGGTPSLVRRLDDFESPAPGIWPLMRASHVAIAADGNGSPVAAAIHGGELVVTPAVEDCTVRIALGDGGFNVAARAIEVAATPYGVVWTVVGNARCGQESAPATLTLEYQGAYRRAKRAWAWFAGRGRIRPAEEDSREVVADLLFEAPTSLAVTRT